MDPKFINAHAYLYDAYTARGRYDEAVAAYFAAEELSSTTPVDTNALDELRSAYAVGGIHSFWQARLSVLQNRNQSDAFRVAKYKTRLGDHDEALGWLERAIEAREFDAIYFLAEPSLRVLSPNPRFVTLASTFLNEASNGISRD